MNKVSGPSWGLFKSGGSLRILVEATAIALGIFLSLWADQWREDRSLAAEGRESLGRIALNLAADTTRMASAAAQSGASVNAIDSILNSDASDPSTPSRVANWIPWVLQSNVFNAEGDEYEALRSSGRLGLISNPHLLAAVISYYRDLEYIAEMYRFDIDQSHAVGELMYPHIEFPRSGFVRESGPVGFPTPQAANSVVDLLTDRVFVNEMTYLGFLKQNLAGSATSSAAAARALLLMIEQDLAR